MLSIEFLEWLLIIVLITIGSIAFNPHYEGIANLLTLGKWMVVVLLGMAVFGVIYFWIDERREERREQRAAAVRRARRMAIEAQHPGTRVTPLSGGRWLLTDLATGKTVGEISDAQASSPD